MDTIGDFQFMTPAEYSKGAVPWCLRPEKVTPPEAERALLQECKRVWLRFIDTRIASYEKGPVRRRPPSSQLTAEIFKDFDASRASNRVLGIAELLEKILGHASSSAHLIALDVCQKWRDVALHIMRPSSVMHDFSHAYPCPPVKFGDEVQRQLNWLPATDDEFEYVASENDANLAFQRNGIYRGMDRFQRPEMPDIINTVCYPGRITMGSNATSDQIYSTKLFYYEQLLWHNIEARLNSHTRHVHVPRWVDITQFRLNEYFTNLFHGESEVINGLFEISLQSSCHTNCGICWDSLSSTAMSYLATQYLTQPPVISLNVSTWVPMMEKPRVRKALHIVNVRNEDGINVAQLLAAMKAASGLAIEHWKHWARLLHAAVESGHPKQDIWVVDGRPKLLISLDPFASGQSSAKSLFYLSCMHALPERQKRQEEWVPKRLW